MNKIIKTTIGTICLVFLIASGVPLMSNDGLLKVVGLFNYFSGSILLYFILYRYCSMEQAISEIKKRDKDIDELAESSTFALCALIKQNKELKKKLYNPQEWENEILSFHKG